MKLKQMNLLSIGLVATLTAAPVQAEPAAPVHISQAIPLGNGLEQESGWYGSINPSVVFGPSVEGESEAFTLDSPPQGCIEGRELGENSPVNAICTKSVISEGTEVESFSLSLETDTGFGISGVTGYRFTPEARAELELGYSRNNVNALKVGNIGLDSPQIFIIRDLGLPSFETDLDGKLETWSLLASGYYDINTNSNFKPYLGGGIGVARLSASDIEADIPGINRRIDLDDSGASFIFQVKAGTAYQIGDRGSVSLGYRLQGLPGQSFEAEGIDFDAQTVLTHAVEFGGQYRF